MDSVSSRPVTMMMGVLAPAMVKFAAETPAGANKAFFHYDAQYLLGLGPRTPRVILELARDFHPELEIELPAIDATPTA